MTRTSRADGRHPECVLAFLRFKSDGPAWTFSRQGILTSATFLRRRRPYSDVLTTRHLSATLAQLDAGRSALDLSVVIRHAIRSARWRRLGGGRALANTHSTIGRGDDAPKNHLLRELPSFVRKSLLEQAEYITLPVGKAFARAGDPITHGYFPDDGLLSVITEMTTGHHVAIAPRRDRSSAWPHRRVAAVGTHQGSLRVLRGET